MRFKLFTDLIDALGKVAGCLKDIVNLPKAERETMHRTLDETNRPIDTTLNMLIIRLAAWPWQLRCSVGGRRVGLVLPLQAMHGS